MNYNLVLPLEHIALAKISITLWNQEDARDSLICCKMLTVGYTAYFKRFGNEVMEKVEKLLLPELLKKKLSDICKPIGLQIIKWMDTHDSTFFIYRLLPNEFSWNAQGVIDAKKTAEALIRDETMQENFFPSCRYALACLYCSETDLKRLWNEPPDNWKLEFLDNGRCHGLTSMQDITTFRTLDMMGYRGTLNKIFARRRPDCTLYQCAFECTSHIAFKSSTVHFFQKLTPEEKEKSLLRAAVDIVVTRNSFKYDDRREDYTEVLHFLLSQMNEKQQVELFKVHACSVLKSFLDLPWLNFFMETAKHVWSFLSEEQFDRLVRIIIIKVEAGYLVGNYKQIFGQFWQQSPINYKRYVVNNCHNLDECHSFILLTTLFDVEDRESIMFLLQKKTLEKKEELIFSDIGKVICVRLIYKCNWNLLMGFVSECISSKDKVIKFKEEFKKHISSCYSEEIAECTTYKKFFKLVDELIQKDKKRNMEEGNCSSAKKLCSLTR